MKAQKVKLRRNNKNYSKNNKQWINAGFCKIVIDLRGVRYEAALTELDRYLDTAVLANISPVEIIHGKGTGALRQGVTEFLRSDRRVKSYHFASANAG